MGTQSPSMIGSFLLPIGRKVNFLRGRGEGHCNRHKKVHIYVLRAKNEYVNLFLKGGDMEDQWKRKQTESDVGWKRTDGF